MSRIGDLIRELCPNGVPLKTLAELGTITRGKRFVKADMIASGTPCIHYGEIYTKYGTWATEAFSCLDPALASRLRFAQRGDVIVVSAGETVEDIGKSVAWLGDKDVVIHDALYAFRSPLDPKYVAYFSQTDDFHDQIRRHISSSKVSAVSIESLGKVRIPAPPIAVQQEVVKVLDMFSKLEAELEAELEARRRQYQYYRDALLTFVESTDRASKQTSVRLMAMAEVAEIRSGWGFPNAYQGQTQGAYPFYKVSDMNLVGNETVMTAANNFIDEVAAKKLSVKPAPAGTVIFPKIGAAVATNKKRLLSVLSAYDNNVMGLIPGEQLNPRFLFFWMQTVDLTKLAHDSGAVPSIRKSEMEKLQIPVPSLEEQDRIVTILDKFDALVNDLSSGLPAEIKARRQQYAHYRDRLLTFKEAA